MLVCPRCEAEYRDGFTRCTECNVDLVSARAQEPQDHLAWEPVYRGPEASVRVIEMRLQGYGIPTERLPDNPDFGALSEFHTPQLAGYQILVPSEHSERSRDLVEEAVRSSSWEGGPQEDVAAQAEAEEDYDVRACRACLLYFHETFSECPGCGMGLLPAVEIFEEGQAEPERVIVAVGSGEGVVALSRDLVAGGFDAQAFEVEGWLIAAVDLPWRELTDRTVEAEEIMGLRTLRVAAG